jgi:hypothetical protein
LTKGGFMKLATDGRNSIRPLVASIAVTVCVACAPLAPPRKPLEVPHPVAEWRTRLAVQQWTKIHEQRADDPVQFRRQAHGGAAFDVRRGHIILYGSDTHGQDWTNSPLCFDTQALVWSRLYPNDDPDTYTVNERGIPVAGPQRDHPWAMHTFGAVSYDIARDELVVSSYPAHLAPGNFTDRLAAVWPRIDRHPTWTLDLNTNHWQALPGDAVDFFPYATAYDAERGTIIGYRSDGVYELSGEPREWQKTAEPGLLGYHNVAVYDSDDDVLIVFGSSDGSNDVIAYDPATGGHEAMPTPGLRPPGTQYLPMAYHPGIKKTVALIDPPTNAPAAAAPGCETWLYDYPADRLSRSAVPPLPFRCGMNYNLVYDAWHDALLLVADAPEKRTAVWALRF